MNLWSCQRNSGFGSFETRQSSAWCWGVLVSAGNMRIQRTRFYFVMAIYVENYGVFKRIIKTKTQSTTCNPFTRVIKQQKLHTKQVLFQERGNHCRNVELDLLLSLFYILFDYFSLHNIYPTLYFICLWVSGQSSSTLMQLVTVNSSVQHGHYHQQGKLERWRRYSTVVTSSTGQGWDQPSKQELSSRNFLHLNRKEVQQMKDSRKIQLSSRWM